MTAAERETALAERNAIRKALAAKDSRIRELEEEVWTLRERLNDKSSEFDSISIRYEDETGHEWDGMAFRG